MSTTHQVLVKGPDSIKGYEGNNVSFELTPEGFKQYPDVIVPIAWFGPWESPMKGFADIYKFGPLRIMKVRSVGAKPTNAATAVTYFRGYVFGDDADALRAELPTVGTWDGDTLLDSKGILVQHRSGATTGGTEMAPASLKATRANGTPCFVIEVYRAVVEDSPDEGGVDVLLTHRDGLQMGQFFKGSSSSVYNTQLYPFEFMWVIPHTEDELYSRNHLYPGEGTIIDDPYL